MICCERLRSTVPIAILDEKKTAKTASEFSALLCMSFNNNNDAIIENAIVVRNGKKSRNTPIAIPAKAKCDNVSPTSDILLETTNIPNIGAVIDSIILPISALTIKSWERISSISHSCP
jgi:hypothetical protein